MRWVEQMPPFIAGVPNWALLAVAAALLVSILLELGLRRSRGKPPGQGGRFDAFISYKSEDVEHARRIADRLIASGRRVWFAEYQILLTARDRFQEAIDRGIDRSRFGIAITNDLYAGSEHCRGEMKRLLAHCGPERVMDIGLPPQPARRRNFPQLADSPALRGSGDIDAVLGFIGEVTGWRIAPAPERIGSGPPCLHRDTCLDLPYSVHVTGWTLVDPSFQDGGPCYGLPRLGLLWNLQYGEEFDPAVYDARRAGAEARNDDRALFEAMCDYADGYFSRYRMGEPVGVHLFHLDGVSHFALSYRSGRYWKRRYSAMLVDPQTYKAAE